MTWRAFALVVVASAWVAAGAGLLALSLGPAGAAQAGSAARGRQLYLTSCSSCHGLDARGVPDMGPSLVGVGAGSADLYLSTGRMPLARPGQEPLRSTPAFPQDEVDDLVAYVGSLGGPPVPDVDPARGDVTAGMRAFALSCAGCHQITGRGGVVTGALVPSLADATPVQVAEAVRTGPYVMPAFDERTMDAETLDDVARYVELTQRPDDRGGWSLGNLGPVPEGLVAWLVAGGVLLLVARLTGAARPR